MGARTARQGATTNLMYLCSTEVWANTPDVESSVFLATGTWPKPHFGGGGKDPCAIPVGLCDCVSLCLASFSSSASCSSPSARAHQQVWNVDSRTFPR